MKYVVDSIRGFLMIEVVNESELYYGENDENKLSSNQVVFNSKYAFDSLEDVEREYDKMMAAKRCWFLIENPINNSFRIAEYIDGPEGDYLEENELINGVYPSEELAMADLEKCISQITCFIIAGNKNTGELRQFQYFGGEKRNYLEDNEEIVKEAYNYVEDLYEYCFYWTNRWKRIYEVLYYY